MKFIHQILYSMLIAVGLGIISAILTHEFNFPSEITPFIAFMVYLLIVMPIID